MIKFNPFKALTSKYGIENDEYKNWHCKFAILPVYDMVENRKRWLCNVFRRREEYRNPSPKTKYYWIHIPYNDLELIKHTERETTGEYKPVKYPPVPKSYVGHIFTTLMILIFFGMVGIAITNSVDRADRKTVILEQIDKAQSLDELKTIVKELAEFIR